MMYIPCKVDSLEKPIAIIQQNRDKINDAIKKAEGRAKARTITASDIFVAINELEEHLHHIPKYALKGVFARFNLNGQDFPNAYKYTPESTWFDVTHDGKTWKITDIYRYECKKKKCYLDLPEATKEKIIEKIIEC